jgi:hypothetical protein
LDSVEPLDDYLPSTHRQRALGEADRHDHRQHLGCQAHGHSYREEKGLGPIALGQAVDDEHQGDHHQDESQHQPGETGDTFIESRLR